MADPTQICVSCGDEKTAVEFRRLKGGTIWSPTCIGCEMEQARWRQEARREVRQSESAEPALPDSPVSTDTERAVQSLAREVRALNAKLDQWELFHHPIRTIAYGMIAWSVVCVLIAILCWLGVLLVVQGQLSNLQGHSEIGVVLWLIAGGVFIALIVWMIRLLSR